MVSNLSTDWRFEKSPHVEISGLRSYAGTQLHCQIENGQDVVLGSLCVVSDTPNQVLSKAQQATLVRFADMFTSEIINRSRLTRRRQQQIMGDLLTKAQTHQKPDEIEAAIMDVIHQIYPTASVSLQKLNDMTITLHGRAPFSYNEVQRGLWEDAAYIDATLATDNHKKLQASQTVRAIVGKFGPQPDAYALVVASSDIYLVFDDIDAWFVERCAAMLGNVIQHRSLQEALIAKERFLRGITHQLRTPIHGVLGSVDLLSEELAKGELEGVEPTIHALAQNGKIDYSEVLKIIRNSGRELMSTVNNMIKLNRWAEIAIRPGHATIQDLNRLESEIFDDALSLIPEDESSSISVFFDNRLMADTSIIMIDLGLLKECLQSLFLNALQFTTRGSVITTISAAEDYSKIVFDVEDTGCGIPKADRDRIFDAYEKVDTHTRGAGLGLTLACKIAEAMQGSVKLVSSIEGKGSHFCAEFRNPGFACPISHPRSSIRDLPDLPTSYFVIPSDPPSPVVQHFLHFLKTRGLSEGKTSKGALVTISFTSDAKQFKDLLAHSNEGCHSVCLVPAGENSEHIRKDNPNVMFFSGPFFTSRLDDVLVELAEAIRTAQPDQERIDAPMVQVTNAKGFVTQAEPSAEEAAPGKHERSSKRSRSIQPPNVLLVDDNLINLRIVRMYCEKRHLPYVSAVDGFEAIEAYKKATEKAQITLILLDLQMPKCDGLQACREIRAYEEEQHLPRCVIFMVTGQDTPADRRRSFEAGADEFFVKPMSLKTIDRGIGQYFQGFG